MGAGKYLKVIWLYAIGLALVFSGLYMIALMSAGPLGFELMIAGFFFCMVGGVYGKKKLMEGDMAVEPVATVSRQVEQIKQNVVSQLKPMETAPAQPQPIAQPVPQPVIQPAPAVQQPQIVEREPEQPALTGGIVKVMVCPDCNTENSPQNMYCSNCGKRLRAAPSLKKPAATAAAPQRRKAAKKKKARPKAQQQEQQQ